MAALEGSADTGVLTVGNWDLAAMMDGRTRAGWRDRERGGNQGGRQEQGRRNSAECCWRRREGKDRRRRRGQQGELKSLAAAGEKRRKAVHLFVGGAPPVVSRQFAARVPDRRPSSLWLLPRSLALQPLSPAHVHQFYAVRPVFRVSFTPIDDLLSYASALSSHTRQRLVLPPINAH